MSDNPAGVVYVVLDRSKGLVVGVFSSMEKASNCVSNNAFSAYSITELTVDAIG